VARLARVLRLWLPSLIEIDYGIRGLRHDKQPTSGFMRDPGRLDVASVGVECRDQRTPRKGTKMA
jgi:hypothetical protein